MSRFSHALTDAIHAHGWNESYVAKNAKIPQSKVNRWAAGIAAPKTESLPPLLALFDGAEQSKLIIAYLRDNIPPGYETVVTIEATMSGIQEAPSAGAPLQPPEGISRELLKKLYRVAGVARDIPELAAIFTEFDNLIERARKSGRL